MKNRYTAYVRQVGHELNLPRRQKKELLRGLQLELDERLAEGFETKVAINQFGNPKEVADTLFESVTPEVRRRHSAAKLFRLHLVIVILALLLALSVGMFCYFDATRVGRAEITIIEDFVSPQYSEGVGDK